MLTDITCSGNDHWQLINFIQLQINQIEITPIIIQITTVFFYFSSFLKSYFVE